MTDRYAMDSYRKVFGADPAGAVECLTSRASCSSAATGLVGNRVMEAAVGRSDFRLVALTRREAAMPHGARMEMMVAQPQRWEEAVALIACRRGDLCARHHVAQGGPRRGGVPAGRSKTSCCASPAPRRRRACAISCSCRRSERTPRSKALYLRVKGEVEARLRKLGFHRLDILRPGLLRGPRSAERRFAERLGIIASPVTNLFLTGARRQYRAIDARLVALAALQATREKARGSFVHDNDGIMRLARRLELAS